MERWPVVNVSHGPFMLTAKHRLPHAANPDGHVLHEHTWRITVITESEIQPVDGWTWDEDEIKQRVNPLIAELTGRDLGEIISMPATTEALAIYLLCKLPGWVEGVSLDKGTGSIATVTRKMNGRSDLRKYVIAAAKGGE